MFVVGPDGPRASASDALVDNHDVTATIADLAAEAETAIVPDAP